MGVEFERKKTELIPLFEKYRKWWWVGALSLVFLTGVGVLVVPTSRTLILQKYLQVRQSFVGEEPQTTADPITSEVQQLTEQVAQLQSQVSGFAQQHSTDQKNLIDVEDQFKKVTSEAADVTTAWQKQELEWQKALRAIGVSVKSDATVFPSLASPPNSSASGSTSADGKININSATLAQLETLPGIGPSFAQRILDYRKQKGAFQKIDDIMNVVGIKEAIFGKIKEKISV